jgi:exonuclease III
MVPPDRIGPVLTVASVNVNGVRAAVRRGMPAWLAERRPDVLCLQEVRAGDDELAVALGDGWHAVHEEASAKGRAGVAVAGRPRAVYGREADLKNWRGNLRKSGFLPEERAWFDRLLGELGWVDVVRSLAGEGPGPYSWWSWRGKAFDLDSGWRIDYQIASPGLAARAVKAEIDRAPSYRERWSDHAPVLVRYDLEVAPS